MEPVFAVKPQKDWGFPKQDAKAAIKAAFVF
jgi:hypothetical protein